MSGARSAFIRRRMEHPEMARLTGAARRARSELLRLATLSTKIKLQKPGAGPVGYAALVEPRYWMGEF